MVLSERDKPGRRGFQQRRPGWMTVLDPSLSWLELWTVLFLVRAGAWLVFLLSRAMAGASTKLEIKHQPATDTFSMLQTARSAALETCTVFLSRPMGGTIEDTSTAASGKTCFSFLMNCLHMLSVIAANLHVLTPMWITTRLTSIPWDVCQPVVDVMDG